MRSLETDDVSLEPTLLGALSDEQKERLADVLDRYLSSLDEAVPLNRSTLIAQHADLAEPLAAYLDRLDELHDAAAGFAGGQAKSLPQATAPADGEKQIGDFRLIREVGRGGMGVVYEAWQVSLGRRVALKVLPFAAVLDSKQIARFRNEAQAAAQLHHSNIVPVYAVGVERGVHFYAMQFIDGQPLDQAIDELRATSAGESQPSKPSSAPSSKPPKKDAAASPSLASTVVLGANSAETYRSDRNSQRSLLKHDLAKRGSYYRTAVRLGIEAAEALHAAHEFGVVHRDVKPSNLLLDGDGKIWVTDFGLARIQTSASLTRTGDLVGTMRYMSPEQASGKAALVDQRTDVYSLGATLYELVTLRPAFEGDDGPTLLRRIEQEAPRPLRQLAPRAPADLETVIHKAMAKSPSERYATAKELADDLRRVLEGQPTLAKPPTLVDRLAKWARRHRQVVLAAAAIAICAIVSLAAGTAIILREKAEAERNFARADADYRIAREAVDRLGVQMAQRLENEPGATHFRRELLQEALAYYQEFINRAKEDPRFDDPRVQVDMASAYGQIGELTERIDGSAEALPAFRDSCRLFEQALAADPSRLTTRRGWGEALNKLGLAAQRAGRLTEAREAFGAALAIRTQLVEATSGDPQHRSDLALSLSNMGLLQLECKETPAARKSLLDAIAIQRELVDADRDNAAYLKNLATSHNNLVAVYRHADPAAGLEACRGAVEYMSQAQRAEPRNVDYQSSLGKMYSNLGSLQGDAGNFAAAENCFRRAIDLQRPLHRASAENKTFRRDLAVTCNNFGLLQARLRHNDDAERSFREALALYEPLPNLYPHDHSLSSDVGGVYNNLGFLLAGIGRNAEAGNAYRRAIQFQRAALDEAPSNEQYREYLGKHYLSYANILRRLNRPEDAMHAALSRGRLCSKDADKLLAVAEELALVWRMMAEREEMAAAARTCAAHVLSTLIEAARHGDPTEVADKVKRNAAFAGLVDRPEFAELFDSNKTDGGQSEPASRDKNVN